MRRRHGPFSSTRPVRSVTTGCPAVQGRPAAQDTGLLGRAGKIPVAFPVGFARGGRVGPQGQLIRQLVDQQGEGLGPCRGCGDAKNCGGDDGEDLFHA